MKIRSSKVVLVLALCLTLSRMASAKILFEDDFEADEMGQEPSKWEYDPSAEVTDVAQIIQDPAEGDQCMSNFGGYVVKDSKEWTDYVVEFDWMFTEVGRNESVAFRYQDSSSFYQLSKRTDMQSINIYMYNGAWNQIGSEVFPVDINVWYRTQLKVEGSTFTVKMKEKEDQTLFSDIKPVLEIDDSTYDKGGFSTAYYGPIDDVVIAESEAEIIAVEPLHTPGLSTTWADIKNE